MFTPPRQHRGHICRQSDRHDDQTAIQEHCRDLENNFLERDKMQNYEYFFSCHRN
jgi:hypothetical protein